MRVSFRDEREQDRAAVGQVHRLAFGREDEALLVDELRQGGHVRVSLVAEASGQVVGHILFTRLPIITERGVIEALALAPLAVLPEQHRRGIGSGLVRRGLEVSRARGHRVAVVVGDPGYYGRFGFSADLGRPLSCVYAGEHFMAVELVAGALDGVAGRVEYPEPFGRF